MKNKDQESYIPFHQVKCITLHTATSITYEVISVAIQNNTEILFADRRGFPLGRVWSHHFGSIATIRKNQLGFSMHKNSIEWIRDILIKKAENQVVVIDLLAIIIEKQEQIVEVKSKISMSVEKIKKYYSDDRSETFASFRGYEGSMSKNYFKAISALLPKKYSFQKRSQHPALDGFNCLLNYAYGMLYGHCESALINAGIDPHIGVMHRDEYNRPVLVYDFIEQFRHWADYVVCHLCLQEIVENDFFDLEFDAEKQPVGAFWLNTIGKRILIQSFNEYLNEVIIIDGISRSRLNHIFLLAQKTATLFKTFSPLNDK